MKRARAIAPAAACAAFASAAAAAAFFARLAPGEAPQVARGEDALSVAFGDAKDTISRAMIHKADSYFHGGIDMDCTLDGHTHDAHDGHAHDAHEHDGGEHGHAHDAHAHGEAEHHDGATELSAVEHGRPENEVSAQGSVAQDAEELDAWAPDPWRWINTRIRAPEIEKHLENDKAVEMMPWIWAAVRANPHNTDAWTTAAYVAYNKMKDRPLALQIMREARAKNPDNLEIAWQYGRVLYDRGNGDTAAAKAVFEAAQARVLEICGGDLEKLSEDDALNYRYIKGYLNAINH